MLQVLVLFCRRTKVFLKYWHVEKLLEQLQKAQEAVITIQKGAVQFLYLVDVNKLFSYKFVKSESGDLKNETAQLSEKQQAIKCPSSKIPRLRNNIKYKYHGFCFCFHIKT